MGQKNKFIYASRKVLLKLYWSDWNLHMVVLYTSFRKKKYSAFQNERKILKKSPGEPIFIFSDWVNPTSVSASTVDTVYFVKNKKTHGTFRTRMEFVTLKVVPY
jgi:hypothetical protein